MEEKTKEQLLEELNSLRSKLSGLEKSESERKRTEEDISWQNAVLDAINKIFEEALVRETEKDVAEVCLSVAEKLTGSKFGFIGEINEAGRFDTMAMSDPGWEACKIPKTNAVRMITNMEIRGIWGKVIKEEKSVIVNDPASEPCSVGTPEGHPKITAFLGAPLKRGGKVFGMIGLANKEGGYNPLDRESVEALSLAFVEALMRKRIEVALRQSRSDYSTLLKNIPQKIFYKDLNSVYVLCNGAYARDLHIEPGGIKGKTDYDFYPKELAEKYINDDKRIMQSGEAEDIEEKYIVNGQDAFVRTFKAPLRDGNNNTIGIFGVFWDITGRKKSEAILVQERDKAQNYLDIAGTMIVAIDNRGEVTLINRKGCQILGYKEEEIIGKDWFDNFLPRRVRKQIKAVSAKLLAGEVEPVEYYENPVLTKSGEERIIAWHNAALRDEAGNVVGHLSSGADITPRKKIEEQLRILNRELLRSNKRLKQIALRDIHTGLYNHRYLAEVIEAEFYRSKRYGHPFSVIMLDIDYFKSINDVYGHQFGDLVLKQFARFLKKIVRRYDVVVRFGGEEFVIVSSGIDKTGALLLAQRLLDAISLFNFGNKKHAVKLKLSAGVTSSPEDKTVKAMDLIELAEQIIDKVKEHGGDRVYSVGDIKKKGAGLNNKKEPADIKFLKERIEKLTKKSNQNLIEAVFAFAKTIKLKDRYTGDHTERIVYYATEIARALGLPTQEIELVKQASILHDLGKIGISDEILLKPARLTKKEFEEIKKHPQIGVDIIRPIQFLHSIIPLILYHHERWDGNGYPKGLKGDEIPVGARIVAIADVYQALISDRPYRPAFNQQEAVKIIKEGAGTQFDLRIVNVFLKVLQRGKSRKF
ncbi:MAG: diguanylate cyclase [Candidatus Omnitrophota bacterium]